MYKECKHNWKRVAGIGAHPPYKICTICGATKKVRN